MILAETLRWTHFKMSFQCGIVGLPNVGKSTIFNALTASNIPAENYPFCTIEPHLGIVELPDIRIDNLVKIYKPNKIIKATVEFIDIAGLVKGASEGEGLGNQFLGQIRQTSAILHVIRCFEDDNITHVDGSIDPLRDIETIETELLLSDLLILEKRQKKTEKLAKSGNKEALYQLNIINNLIGHCGDGKKASSMNLNTSDEISFVETLQLLSNKPFLYIANVKESELDKKNEYVELVYNYALAEKNKAITISASIEQEIALLSESEKKMFLDEYNLEEPGLNRVIKSSFELLNLQTYFTAGPEEVKAWTIPTVCTAPKAAGVIHSDFERGFIKADVFHFSDIIKYKSEKILSEKGLIRQEGKEYLVKDGDCIFFRFNV